MMEQQNKGKSDGCSIALWAPHVHLEPILETTAGGALEAWTIGAPSDLSTEE
jgi:hypothetical protein